MSVSADFLPQQPIIGKTVRGAVMRYIPRHMDDVRNCLGGNGDNVAVQMSGVTLPGRRSGLVGLAEARACRRAYAQPSSCVAA